MLHVYHVGAVYPFEVMVMEQILIFFEWIRTHETPAVKNINFRVVDMRF